MTSPHGQRLRDRGARVAMAAAVIATSSPALARAGGTPDGGAGGAPPAVTAWDGGAPAPTRADRAGDAGIAGIVGGAGGAGGGAGGADGPRVDGRRGADGPRADGGAGGAPATEPATSAPLPPPPPPSTQVRIRTVQKGTRRPLGGAAISVDAVSAGETDAEGRLALRIPIGSHQLEAQFPGHAPLRQPLDVTAAEAKELTLRLVPDRNGERFESEVRVTHAEKPRLSVTVEEARQTAGTSGDPVRVLASLPGVSQVVWPVALFVVRGANPGNTGFFIDGIRVPATFHLALGPSIINPSLVGSLDFFPGAYPESFGHYVSGIVSIQTAQPPTDRAHVEAGVTFYDALAMATVPVDNGRGVVAAAARYSYTGPLLSLFDPQTHLLYGDYQLRFDHGLFGDEATIFAFGSLDRLDWNTRLGQTTSSASTIQTAALQFHRLDFRWVGAVGGGRLVAAITTGYDAARSTLSQAPLTVVAVDLAPRLLWTHALGRVLDFELGADAELQHFTATPLPLIGKPGDIARSRPALSQGTFTALRLHLGDRLIVTPGLRTDLFVEEGTSRFAVEPRLDARLSLSPGFALKANAGRFTQMPSLPVNVAGFESFGLASIGLQRSDSVALGIDARLPGDTAVEVTGFYSRIRVTDLVNTDITMAQVAESDFLHLDDGVGYGLEAMIRRPASHRFYGWLAYTLSYSYRNGTNGVVRSDWDQRHILNLVTNYRLGGGYVIGARAHYNTGRDAPIYQMGEYRETPAYYQLDLRAEREILLDRFVLTVFVDIANATFNRELIQYVVTNNGRSEPTYLHIVLPTIGLHGAF